MQRIQTVMGPISPIDLGFCQSHEHLCILNGQSARVNPALRIDDEEQSQKELARYAAAGGKTLVDAQPVGCGRDPHFLHRISEQSGVNIIASTGFHKLIFYPEDHWIHFTEEDSLADLFIKELTCGMFTACDDTPPREHTDILAGQIKTALDRPGLTPRYRLLFRAAARAAIAAGAPLMVHIEQDADPLALADFLGSIGVPMERLIFCHLDRAVKDIRIHLQLCEMGITLEYDTVAREKYHSNERELEIVRAMLDAGFEDRLLMSLDVTRARLKSYGGQVGLDYILKQFLPRMREYGVTMGQITKIFRSNPVRTFTIHCGQERGTGK